MHAFLHQSSALACGALLISALHAGAAEEPRLLPHAALAAAHPQATAAGHETLARGGNAFDAAVAVAAALAVVEPYGSGLGGGGFFLLHRAGDRRETMIDARERAPFAAHATMYLDADGEARPGASLNGPLAAGIPGIPAALAHLTEHYGRLTLAQSLAPAIKLATEGFAVTARYREMAERREETLRSFSGASAVFLADGFVPDLGHKIRQPALAETLRAIAARGAQGFYRGRVAERLLADVRAAGGIWSEEDLAEYSVVERAPIRARYRNMEITSAPPPSSGGIVLAQALGILAGFKLPGMSEVERSHRVIEAMRLAYRDRARHLGDADFVPVDVAALLDARYLASLRRLIGKQALASRELADPAPLRPAERANTTHFSIIDREGNRVAATLSVNGPFGSGFLSPATGVLLNNEMDDFAIKPGQPNLYGLVGSRANAIAPGKRPLSSMTPTFLETEDSIVVLGTPGGSRIISMVLLAALEIAEGRGGARDWVSRGRYHHQFLPDRVEYEPAALSEKTVAALRRRGHELAARESGYGNMQLVRYAKRERRLTAAADPRGEGAAEVK